MQNLEMSFQGTICVVKAPSRVDVSNASILLETIKGQVEAGSRQVVIDLVDTEALDSTALGALVQLYKWLRLAEGSLSLAGVSDAVNRVLILTRLDEIFPLYPDVQSATEAQA